MKTLLKGSLVILLIGLALIFEIQAQSQGTSIGKDRNYNKPVGVYNASSAGSATNASAGLKEICPELGEICGMYLSDDWQSGTIAFKGNVVYEDVPMRYNIYNQQIEFVQDDDTAAIGDRASIESIYMGQRHFVYGTFICNNKVQTGFMEVLSEGRLRLLAYRCIRYVSVENDPEPGDEPSRTFHLEKTYLYAFPGEYAQKLPEKKKELMALFTSEMSDIKSYLKSQRNKMRTEPEIVAAFNYYNEGF